MQIKASLASGKISTHMLSIKNFSYCCCGTQHPCSHGEAKWIWESSGYEACYCSGLCDILFEFW